MKLTQEKTAKLVNKVERLEIELSTLGRLVYYKCGILLNKIFKLLYCSCTVVIYFKINHIDHFLRTYINSIDEIQLQVLKKSLSKNDKKFWKIFL